MGAWIETLSGARGVPAILVAPYVGAWIETTYQATRMHRASVAPYVGAWIETVMSGRSYGYSESHPTWVRGLKLYQQ